MKKQRLSSMQKLDRISFLPESIRRHILSFLPMEDAVRTSLLSKNWRHVCSYLPNLEFNESVYRQKKYEREGLDEFKDIIDQMLLFNDNSNIKRFMLRFYMSQKPISTQHLNAWISFVVRHNVQELTLSLDHWSIENFPSCLFTCSTLTTLELNRLRLRLPTTIGFPLLKSLVLDRIGFMDENSTNKLFSSSSCPVLEDLIILCCYQSIPRLATTHTVSFSKLKLLKISENDFFFNKSIDFNLQTNLFISNLHKFAYKGKEPPQLSCETLSLMSHAKFTLMLPPTNSNDACKNSASKILMGLRNLVTLSLKGFYIEFLTRDQDVSTSLVTSSHSLKTLKLHMHATKNQLQVVTFLLRRYRNVQSLSIYFSQEDYTSLNMLKMEEYWQSEVLSMRDTLSHLKTVEIGLFQGSDIELDLVRYLLVSSSTLERIRINLQFYTGDREEQMRLSAKLLTFTRISPNAAIYLS